MRGVSATPTEQSPLHESGPSQQPDAPNHNPGYDQYQSRPNTLGGALSCRAVYRAARVVHFIGDCSGFPTNPDAPRVVGAGRDRRSRRRSGRERSVPAPISRGRSGHHPAFEGTGSCRTQQRGDRRDLVPGAGTAHFSGAVAYRDTIASVATHASHWLRFLGACLDRLAREPRFRSFAVSALLQH
jgi:hypothetical protein